MKIHELQREEPHARVHVLVVSALLCYARKPSSEKIASIAAGDPRVLKSAQYRCGLCFTTFNVQMGYGEDAWWTDFGEFVLLTSS